MITAHIKRQYRDCFTVFIKRGDTTIAESTCRTAQSAFNSAWKKLEKTHYTLIRMAHPLSLEMRELKEFLDIELQGSRNPIIKAG